MLRSNGPSAENPPTLDDLARFIEQRWSDIRPASACTSGPFIPIDYWRRGADCGLMGFLIYSCSNCDAVIYDRTKGSCAVCEAPLPEQSFLTPAEADRMSRQDAETDAGRKRDCGKQELEEQTRGEITERL